MRVKVTGIVALLAAWGSTLKLCCLLPGLLSLLGLAGTTAALVARWFSPALLALSLALLGHSFYTLYGRGRGTRFSKVTTWASAASVAGFWAYRILSS
jgi:hypothetical protein